MRANHNQVGGESLSLSQNFVYGIAIEQDTRDHRVFMRFFQLINCVVY
ncbi:MAG: hypothetical protein BWY75_02421 [bacterium ADurb.Bin425]|nr:MAG: hypothetical protein BWY75_02421 [bacterium ADurb.Bin425]